MNTSTPEPGLNLAGRIMKAWPKDCADGEVLAIDSVSTESTLRLLESLGRVGPLFEDIIELNL